jgi:hypothetical protein
MSHRFWLGFFTILMLVLIVAEEFIPGWDGTEFSEWFTSIEMVVTVGIAYLWGKHYDGKE